MDRKIEKRKLTFKRILIFLSIAVFIIFVGYVFLFGDSSRKLNVEKDRLTISTVKKASFQEFILVSGTIEPIQTIYLDLSEGGKVVQKYVQEGAILNAGDPIIKLDNPNLLLQVMSTQSSFLQAESYARLTRLTFEQNLLNKQDQLLNVNLNLLEQERVYKNNKVLFAKGLIAKNEFENNRDKYETMLQSKELLMQVLKKDSLTFQQLVEQSETNKEMSKKYLALVKDQVENLTVRAPIKGQLTALDAEIGQSFNNGFRIGQIDNIDSFKVRVEIDEHYITRITVGQVGKYEYNNKNYFLRIKTIYPQVRNGRFLVDMIFKGKEPEGMRRGQTVRLKLQLGNVSEALVIDRGGFYQTTGGQWIFVLNKSGNEAVKKQIKLGRQNINQYEVLEGIQEGESVIISSYDNYGDVEKLILQ